MKSYLLPLIFVIAASCSQGSGGLRSPSGSVSRSGAGSSSSDDSRGGGTVSGLSMRYQYPNVPTIDGAKQYYVTSFADRTTNDLQQQLIAKNPAGQIRVDGLNPTDGSTYCFSNEVVAGNPNCARPSTSSAVIQEIKSFQPTPTGKQPVFINAVQFSFSNQPRSTTSSTDWFSEAIFEGAYVEKAPISFDSTTGRLRPVQDSDLIKLSYGANCDLNQNQYAVGFNDIARYAEQDFYLTGIYPFERTQRKAFAEVTEVRKANICQSAPGAGQWMCNLLTSRASVSYAAFFPVLYAGGRVGGRQFPAPTLPNGTVAPRAPEYIQQTVSNGFERANFGLYASSTDQAKFITTPEIGKVTGTGEAVNNWQQYFITKLCIRGRRRERDLGGTIVDRPLIIALRAELRSPYIYKVR